MEPGLSGSYRTMRMGSSYAQPSGIFVHCSPCDTNPLERLRFALVEVYQNTSLTESPLL